ncbi:predicted protein [Botrytis cinerea T4]|uniref:Uncharacterized protein n=1 Tax=Botryotinia fuckeliana (strain T4) TaxID=999810 RepID=G2XW73_BOTF4|nr:predicted protein [Botrytis cinerea T4]
MCIWEFVYFTMREIGLTESMLRPPNYRGVRIYHSRRSFLVRCQEVAFGAISDQHHVVLVATRQPTLPGTKANEPTLHE